MANIKDSVIQTFYHFSCHYSNIKSNKKLIVFECTEIKNLFLHNRYGGITSNTT